MNVIWGFLLWWGRIEVSFRGERKNYFLKRVGSVIESGCAMIRKFCYELF